MTKATSDCVLSYGIDASAGGYFGVPVSAETLASSITNAVDPVDEVAALKIRAADSVGSYAVRAGIDPNDLSSAGWGIIFASDCPEEIVKNLEPLRTWRRSQAGKRYREYVGVAGYRKDESVRNFLARQGMGMGFADPDRVPYYLLLVGGPADIPFQFQYRLDIQYAVGRITFDEPGLYKRYASSVVSQEQASTSGCKNMVIFAPENPDDPATALSRRELAGPVATRCAAAQHEDWHCIPLLSSDATKENVIRLLMAETPKQLVFTASHGLCFEKGHERQISAQGALVCQDWPGPDYQGEVPSDWYVGASDIERSHVKGTIAFFFACYGAGTPARDYFPERSRVGVRDIAPRTFVASLPKALLGHENGSALAVVGHVERAWNWSFWWPNGGAQVGVYEDFVGLLMDGRRVGYAMEQFGQRYAELGSELSDIYNELRTDPAAIAEPVGFSSLWTARNDARSFVILGDPAVRIS